MDGHLLDIWRAALTTASLVAAPFLVAALAVGLVMSLIQAATQMQENVLAFVPKMIAVGLVLLIAGHWVLGQLTAYTRSAVDVAVQIGKARQ